MRTFRALSHATLHEVSRIHGSRVPLCRRKTTEERITPFFRGALPGKVKRLVCGNIVQLIRESKELIRGSALVVFLLSH